MSIDMKIVKELANHKMSEIHRTADLARILGVNVHTLRAEFSRLERMPIGTWLSRLKVERIKERLMLTDEPCKCICFSVGYHREDVCARMFRRLTGMTMQEYRLVARPNSSSEPDAELKIANQESQSGMSSESP